MLWEYLNKLLMEFLRVLFILALLALVKRKLTRAFVQAGAKRIATMY